ncbi:TSUP family transporter [Amycolatopsis cihanbeyliensis]|uniref:Probable membrane transporter protein n=1 Tax=Amycolatopsis cihanbeyliensis TaxID=1128664 RepID=A0A542DDB1_AMYCI|nr:TSUP family transporter [Amycolatopsis cihanbeyliensis]TQJ01067.1 hypothetical protein FB471_0731 [Amycolatopsis cihanbeyliensis]
MSLLLLLTIIPALAVIQSVFGVGLLFFGTPLLLILGYQYVELLYVLLPASLTLSLLQIRFDHTVRARDATALAVWTVPAIVAGMFTSLLVLEGMDIRYPVAALLVCVAVMRLVPAAHRRLRRGCAAVGRPAITAIALLHGLTNMGGGLLAVYAGARSEDKKEIHRTVALAYALFALSQLVTLYVVHGPPLPTVGLLGSVAGVVAAYVLVGRRVYQGLSNRRYQLYFSAFMLTGAGVLMWQAS